MTDFFISKLPSGHAVKDITKAAAVASLRGDTIVQMSLATTVPFLRQQCAAVVWLRSDVCTADNLEKLAPADRAYLLKLCGLPSGGSSKVQARRILDHLKLHPGDGGSSSGGGGGGPAASGGPSSSGGPPPSGISAGGGSGNGGAGSLPAALLSPAAAAALHMLVRADSVRLLDEAGVPYDTGETTSTLRDKCSVAAWAAEQLRARSTFVHCRTQCPHKSWTPSASPWRGSPSRRTAPSTESCAGVEIRLGPGTRPRLTASYVRSGPPYSARWKLSLRHRQAAALRGRTSFCPPTRQHGSPLCSVPRVCPRAI